MMDFGDLPAGPMTSLPDSASDTNLGTFALTSFWMDAQSLNPQMPSDWASFLELLRRAYYPRTANEAPVGYTKSMYFPNKSPEALEAFLDGFGFSLRSVGLDQNPSHIQEAMQSLASHGGGTIPVDPNAFFHAVQNEAQQFSFFDAAAFVVSQSAQQIASGVQEIGQDVLSTGSSILAMRNYILIAIALLGAYILYKRYGGSAKAELRANPTRRRKSRKSLRKSKAKKPSSVLRDRKSENVKSSIKGTGNSPTRTSTSTANTGKSGNSPTRTSTRAVTMTVTQGAGGGSVRLSANAQMKDKKTRKKRN